MKLKIVLTV